jgi:hypothetical protein
LLQVKTLKDQEYYNYEETLKILNFIYLYSLTYQKAILTFYIEKTKKKTLVILNMKNKIEKLFSFLRKKKRLEKDNNKK